MPEPEGTISVDGAIQSFDGLADELSLAQTDRDVFHGILRGPVGEMSLDQARDNMPISERIQTDDLIQRGIARLPLALRASLEERKLLAHPTTVKALAELGRFMNELDGKINDAVKAGVSPSNAEFQGWVRARHGNRM